jgi:hypothetical protein
MMTNTVSRYRDPAESGWVFFFKKMPACGVHYKLPILRNLFKIGSLRADTLEANQLVAFYVHAGISDAFTGR